MHERLGSVGLVLNKRKVVNCIECSSSALSGRIGPGDKILRVNGKPAKSSTVNTKLEGPVGTVVQVLFRRADGTPVEVSLMRSQSGLDEEKEHTVTSPDNTRTTSKLHKENAALKRENERLQARASEFEKRQLKEENIIRTQAAEIQRLNEQIEHITRLKTSLASEAELTRQELEQTKERMREKEYRLDILERKFQSPSLNPNRLSPSRISGFSHFPEPLSNAPVMYAPTYTRCPIHHL